MNRSSRYTIILGLICLCSANATAQKRNPEIQLMMNLGIANGHLMRGNTGKAFKMLLEMRKTAKTNFYKGKSDLQLAKAYLYVSDFTNAIRFYKEGIARLTKEEYEKNKGRYDTLPFEQFIVNWGHQKLGYCYWKAGKLRAARVALERALKIMDEYNQTQPSLSKKKFFGLIMTLENLTDLTRQAGDKEASRKFGERSLKLVRQLDQWRREGKLLTFGSFGEATLAVSESRALASLGRNDEALAAINRAIEVTTQLSDKSYERFAKAMKSRPRKATTQMDVFHQLERCELLKKLGRKDEALKSARRALGLATDTTPQPFNPYSKGNLKEWLIPSAGILLGDLCAAEGNTKEAEKAFRAAVEAIERLYKSTNSTQMRRTLADRKGVLGPEPAYLRLAELLAQQGKWDEAFAIAEKGRGRALVDSIGNASSRETGVARLTAEEVAEEQAIRNKIQRLKQMLMVARFNPKMNTRSVKSQIRAGHEEYTAFRQRLAIRHPGYALFQNVQTFNAKEVNQLFTERKQLQTTAILSFVQAGDTLLGFCFDGKTFTGKVLLKSAKAKVRNLVVKLRNAITDKTNDWKFPAQELETLLVRPFESQIEGKLQLVLVPHGILHQLPFATLCDEGGQTLVQRFRISVLPTISILRVWNKEVQPFEAATQKVLGIINPDGSLPHAERESNSLKQSFQKVQLLVGNKATEDRFMQLVRGANVIHLATHGVANRIRPQYSHLILAPSTNDDFDGILDAHEIARKVDARNAQLVVLSACQTHIGPANRGDEVQSIANAFLYAGAREVLASLWPVSDRSTAKLMDAFYDGLRHGHAPAAALQRAMTRLAEQGEHPYHWSGFQLIGEH